MMVYILSTQFCEQKTSIVENDKIKNFTEFLEKSLNRTVLGYTLKPLTNIGDNYSGVLKSVVGKVGNDVGFFNSNNYINRKNKEKSKLLFKHRVIF